MRPRSQLLLLLSAIMVVVLLNVSASGLTENTRLCKTLWYFRNRGTEHCGSSQEASRPQSGVGKTPLLESVSMAPTPSLSSGTCEGTHAFPKSIHLLWKDKNPPPHLKPFVDSWKKHNPEWEVKIWDDDSLTVFLKHNLAPAEFEQWSNFPSSVGKMDVARLLLMQLLGGVYSDLDVMCYSCLNALLSRQESQVNLLLPKEWSGEDNGKHSDGLISNFWIASIANASAIRFLIGNIPIKIDGKWQWPNVTHFSDYDPDPTHNNFDGVLNTAGPRYIQRRYDKADDSIRKEIAILPSRTWAAFNKEQLWKDIDKKWEEAPDLKEGIRLFEIFGLHFHAGIWWRGPASDKFYGTS